MNEVATYESQKRKLENLCEEHNLVYTFRNGKFPISLTIKPTSGVGEQLSLLAQADTSGEYMSPDAALYITYEDGGIRHIIKGSFIISDSLLSKVKNIFKKMHDAWLLYFFHEVTDNNLLRTKSMPCIDEDSADDEDEEESEEDEAEPEDEADEHEALIEEAKALLRQENKATVSLLQRRLKLGYSRAARLMDELEELGVVGPYNGSEPREVLAYDEPEDGVNV